MNLNDDTTKFAQRHNVKVLNAGRRTVRPSMIKTSYFDHPDDLNIVNSFSTHTAFDTEPLLTVEIPLSELERIANFENQVFNNMAQKGHFNMFETLMEQKEEEKFLKDKYPAVKKAYEHYSLMLKLAKSGEINN